ncbi:MAG: polysaccharide biosynthesis/export family protein [Bacteroidales bacterium]|nr:polysaccharide biosynthesis/export family protein [Bacteroidales bacterium]
MTKIFITKSFKNYLVLLITVGSLYSCIPQKKLKYIQDPIVEKTIYSLNELKVSRISVNDELYIKVASLDDVAFNFFSTQGDNSRMGYSNELSISLLSYTVNDSGYIYFPILGNVFVKDLTLDEARTKFETTLSEYFNQPSVIIKFAYKRISVLGEVNAPGNYTYTKDHLNVFEALSLAGDISLHGNRREVILIRTENNSIIKQKLDLTRDACMFNNNFFLKSNDILYVKPRSSLTWSVISTPISLFLTAITTAVLVLNYVQNE